MQTRSQGNEDLIRYIDNINQLPRDLREQRDRIQSAPPTLEDMAEPPTVQGRGNNVQGPHLQVPQVRRARPIGAGDAPSPHTQRLGITPPAIPNNNFEIKSGLISMVQSNKFHGFPSEDPLDHLDEFDRLCSLTKINGVSEDAFKLTLFPFSLGDKAHHWEKTLPHGTITTWSDCKTAFLAKFFSNSRTARLRNEISGFVQRNGETFSEAWERFKRFTTQCPHHGFSNESLLSTLYRGALPRVRMLLDTASNGNFLNKDVDEGWALVENLAQSDGNYSEDYDRSHRGSADADSVSQKEIKALNEKLDKLLLAQQKHVQFVCEDAIVQDEENAEYAEVSYVQNQNSYNQGYKQNPQLSYRNTNVANPQDQVYPPRQHLMQHNTPYAPRPQGAYQQQSAPAIPPGYPQQPQPPVQQAPDVMSMFQQLLQGQTTSAKELAQIKTELRSSYNDLNCKIETLNSRLKSLEGQHASSSNVKPSCQLPGKAVQNPKEYTVSAITLSSGRELPTCVGDTLFTEDCDDQDEEDYDIFGKPLDSTPEITLDQDARPDSLESTMLDQNARPDSTRVKVSDPPKPAAKVKPFTPPPYKPQLPFPRRFKKEVVTNDRNAITQAKIVQEKLGDPGTFTLPCSLGPLTFKNCLCDLGASISLMPLSVAQKLGFDKYKPCKISLILADRSVRFPHGLLEDLPIMIGNVEVPTDVVVLDMDEEPRDPLLLGRPFLASAGAVIDVQKRKIELNVGKDTKLEFDIKGVMRKPTIEGQSFSVEGLDQLALGKGSKAADFYKQAQPFDEVLDGVCLESLFASNGIEQPPLQEKCKQPQLNLGPQLTLYPIGMVDGAWEYKVKSKGCSKPFAKVKLYLADHATAEGTLVPLPEPP